mmetsp:Transcript_6002/g.23310  ORF Transcript_6002/g.23310 Transcript_6002/m.23310 type:complete len:166 (-) Transcript_6002:1728-2225(-)
MRIARACHSGLLEEGKMRLLVLDGELEISRAVRTTPTVKLPIPDAPKDYWGDEDKGRFWTDYPEYPLPPPLAEDAEEGAKPVRRPRVLDRGNFAAQANLITRLSLHGRHQEYKWIPSTSLEHLRKAVSRLERYGYAAEPRGTRMTRLLPSPWIFRPGPWKRCQKQ